MSLLLLWKEVAATGDSTDSLNHGKATGNKVKNWWLGGLAQSGPRFAESKAGCKSPDEGQPVKNAGRIKRIRGLTPPARLSGLFAGNSPPVAVVSSAVSAVLCCGASGSRGKLVRNPRLSLQVPLGTRRTRHYKPASNDS